MIDFWAMKRSFFWPSNHHAVLRKIIAMANLGTKIIYMPGNHDGLVREIIGDSVLNVEIQKGYIHTTQDGKKLLLMHGDQFDHTVLCSRWIKIVGYTTYSLFTQC